MMKIATIVGARPQFIKAAVVSRAIIDHNKKSNEGLVQINEKIIHTGQHYDWNMSDVFFEEMHIPKPDHFLDIQNLTHGAMTGQMLEKIEAVLLEEKPDLVIVYGDTNSTLAGALAAAKLHIPVAHVEAGLRSFNRLMPEEINRLLSDHVSNFLFCPTKQAVENLNIEGIGKDRIDDQKRNNFETEKYPTNLGIELFGSKPEVVLVGDVMFDAVLFYRQYAKKPQFDFPQHFVLATIHRAENTDDPERLTNIFNALEKISDDNTILLPLHPRTRKFIKKLDIKFSKLKIKLVDPVSYLNMVYLLDRCKLVMTDSGGLQKEAYFFEKPCLTLRDETEWVELIEHGVNLLAGANTTAIIEAYRKLSEMKISFEQDLYGDGTAGEQIIKIISQRVMNKKARALTRRQEARS
jgi:UDP-GlcNAc3NAcA epimerase